MIVEIYNFLGYEPFNFYSYLKIKIKVETTSSLIVQTYLQIKQN